MGVLTVKYCNITLIMIFLNDQNETNNLRLERLVWLGKQHLPLSVIL